jgi:hypothetical protein
MQDAHPPSFLHSRYFVYSSTNGVVAPRGVPYLNIANRSYGDSYSFSPSEDGDRFNFKNITTRVFNGPRSVLSLLPAATASRGEILALTPPSNHSSYTVRFFGPTVNAPKPIRLSRLRLRSSSHAR